LWQVGKRIPSRLRHLGTQITRSGTAPGTTLGQTLWAWHGQDGDLGMAWDWVQLTPGLVAMADPMAVVSNLRLIDDGGDLLTALASARHFNAIVHTLPWQGEVERLLNTCASAPPGSGATRAARPGRSKRRVVTQ
jgi:hypothetical protein